MKFRISLHIRRGFQAADAGRLRPAGSDTAVVPGVDILMTPGHTPGHLSVVVSSGLERALLLGDAIVCPVQLDEPAWSSIGDVDPALARRTRERLFRKLENPGTVGARGPFSRAAVRPAPDRTRPDLDLLNLCEYRRPRG